MSELNIGLFTDADVFAGTERHMLDLAHALKDHACRVTLLCPEQSILATRARATSLPVLPIEKGPTVNLSAVAQLVRSVRHKAFDVIHAHNGRSALHAALACAVVPRCRLVTTQHFIFPARTGRTGLNGYVTGRAHQWATRHIDHVIAISDAVRTTSLKRGDIDSRKISVVRNGVSDPLRHSLRERSAVRAELGISNDAPVCITVARLEAEKGLSTLVSALAHVHRQAPDLVSLVLGQGSLRPALEKEIAQAGLGSVVRLLGFQTDVFSFVNAADFFVLPSPNEPFGLAIVEAMALSKPIISASTGGPAEIVEHEQTGILCPPADVAAFSAAILQLASSSELRERMGRLGRRRFLHSFTAMRMAHDTRDIYESVVSLRSP